MNKFKKALNQINMNNSAEIPINREKRTDKMSEPIVKETAKAETKQMTEPVVTPAEREPVRETVEAVIKEPEAVTEGVNETVEAVTKDTNEALEEVTEKAEEAYAPSKRELKAEKKALKKQQKLDKKQDKKARRQDKKEQKKAAKEEKKQSKGKPKKEKKTKELTEPKNGGKRHLFKKLIIILLVILIAFGCVWNYHLNKTLRPTFYQVQSSKVVDNVRIVAISDMHLKEFGENNSKLVKKIEAYHPDIIVMAGDMNMESNPDYSIVLNLCARLHDTAPIYYCLGNHEFDAMLFKESQIYYDLKAMGVNILNNEMATAEVGLSKLDIIGLSQGPPQYRQYGAKFFDKAMEDDSNFKLVLTHYPEHFLGTLNDYNIDLAICGHAHGGQIRLPIIGGLYAADQGIFPKLCDGYHEIDNSKVIITRGLGRSGVMPRINNSPEIAVIDINWY